MLEINLETKINNVNFIRYIEHIESENGALKGNMESERATPTEKNKEK